ncbi:HIT domain-containing protein [Candidatus Profftella armatura]
MGIKVDGYKVIYNTGSNAGQEIYYLYFHVLSRFKNDK